MARHKYRGSAISPKGRILKNPNSMANTMMSAQEMAEFDQCRGIHGAARERRGAKKATSAARRRNDKKIIVDAM